MSTKGGNPNRRKTSKAGPKIGSGGGKKGLAGKGRTLKATDRPWHKSYTGDDKPQKTQRKQATERAKAASEGRTTNIGRVKPTRPTTRRSDEAEMILGRNPVLEALRAKVPATALYVAFGTELDDRVAESVRLAGNRDLPIKELARRDLDRRTNNALHQGIGLQIEPYEYAEFEDLLEISQTSGTAPLLVALDGVTDPRNLGAIIRSAAAFGGHGLIIPSKRAASVTAVAWRTSAGAAARLPVAKVVNLTRTIQACQQAGFMTVALDGGGDVDVFDLPVAGDPLLIVVGDEGKGVSRLVAETCDHRVGIPIASAVESLNASVAASIALAEVQRQRR
ncbi:23S rRNA (guanosine(2251)-2'-O)-methyltransferase RlmB [Glycomyces harbinensis]|uniref:23S rRNA (Guanosine2251-2'-O)-methyltransferase n=1 Tax=Glycomyces harbinensis TaxID=58114 RepID=A0A1G6Z358_9ACTN|nr:23S rRNA (guanosine(2251)-2'-O)-methyltransferase RlmB [Glycomyces harbinensis]SDD96723.1 23S rRNA (guanosine2251-2'-O)-methyltransferase [Glycomyces harbinensis]